MRGLQDVEAYLNRLGRPFEAMGDHPGTYVLPSASKTPIALRVEAPLVVLRVHVGDVPKQGNATTLFRRLLTLNAKTQVHATFGLEDDRIVLTSAMQLENLDYNELEAALDELELTLAEQVPALAEMAKAIH